MNKLPAKWRATSLATAREKKASIAKCGTIGPPQRTADHSAHPQNLRNRVRPTHQNTNRTRSNLAQLLLTGDRPHRSASTDR